MDAQAIKAASIPELQGRNITLNQFRYAYSIGEKPDTPLSYNEACDEKKAVQAEILSRGATIRADTRVSTVESKRLAQRIQTATNPFELIQEANELTKQLNAEREKTSRMEEALKKAGIVLALFIVAVGLCFNNLAGLSPLLFGANSLYDLGRQSFLKAEIDMDTDDIIVLLVDASGYTPNLSTDQFLDDISGGAILATSSPLASPTTTAGVFDATDVLFASVPASGQGDYLVLVQDTGVAATSRLIGRIDTGTNLPVTPNGGDINVAWSSGSSKIFKL